MCISDLIYSHLATASIDINQLSCLFACFFSVVINIPLFLANSVAILTILRFSAVVNLHFISCFYSAIIGFEPCVVF